jgi:outer membrane protein assembly factor BamB
MACSHRRGSRRWRQPSLLISMPLGMLLLSACTTSTAGTAATGGALRWRFQTAGGEDRRFANASEWPGLRWGAGWPLRWFGLRAGGTHGRGALADLDRWPGVCPSAVVNGVIYRGSHDGIFSAQDASAGALRWREQTSGSEDASPAVANGVVYVGAGGSLVALDASTGALRWQFPPKTTLSPATGASLGPVRPQVQPSSHPYFAFSTPVVATGVV